MNIGHTIWFTGLSGSGKTTIANKVANYLRKQGIPVVVLDGDEVRKTLSADLGYTKEDRDRHIKRVAHVCKILTDNHILTISCVISPTKEIRDYARSLIKNFIEVYIKCSYEKCEQRDVKGLYKKAKEGEIQNFVGISVPYEEPDHPEVVLDTEKETVDESVHKLLTALKQRHIIP